MIENFRRLQKYKIQSSIFAKKSKPHIFFSYDHSKKIGPTLFAGPEMITKGEHSLGFLSSKTKVEMVKTSQYYD